MIQVWDEDAGWRGDRDDLAGHVSIPFSHAVDFASLTAAEQKQARPRWYRVSDPAGQVTDGRLLIQVELCRADELAQVNVEDGPPWPIFGQSESARHPIKCKNARVEVFCYGLRGLKAAPGTLSLRRPFLSFEVRSARPDTSKSRKQAKTMVDQFAAVKGEKTDPNIGKILALDCPLPIDPFYCPELAVEVLDQTGMGMSRSIGVVTIDLENRLPWRKEFEAHAALLNQLVNMQAALELHEQAHDGQNGQFKNLRNKITDLKKVLFAHAKGKKAFDSEQDEVPDPHIDVATRRLQSFASLQRDFGLDGDRDPEALAANDPSGGLEEKQESPAVEEKKGTRGKKRPVTTICLTKHATSDAKGENGDDAHHLHIRHLKAFDDSGQELKLKVKRASAAVQKGKPDLAGGGKPECALEDSDTITHSAEDHGSQSHWMEFEVDAPHTCLSHVELHNHPDLSSRLVGSLLTITTNAGGKRREKKLIIHKDQSRYKFAAFPKVSEDASTAHRDAESQVLSLAGSTLEPLDAAAVEERIKASGLWSHLTSQLLNRPILRNELEEELDNHHGDDRVGLESFVVKRGYGKTRQVVGELKAIINVVSAGNERRERLQDNILIQRMLRDMQQPKPTRMTIRLSVLQVLLCVLSFLPRSNLHFPSVSRDKSSPTLVRTSWETSFYRIHTSRFPWGA